MATEFERIKRSVEVEKNKKVQGEARINSLNEEEKRILDTVGKELGSPVSNVEEVEKKAGELKTDIEGSITEMRKILEEEGVAY